MGDSVRRRRRAGELDLFARVASRLGITFQLHRHEIRSVPLDDYSGCSPLDPAVLELLEKASLQADRIEEGATDLDPPRLGHLDKLRHAFTRVVLRQPQLAALLLERDHLPIFISSVLARIVPSVRFPP